MTYVYGFSIIILNTLAIVLAVKFLISYAGKPEPLFFEGFDIIAIVALSTAYVTILMLCSIAMFYVG